MEDDFSLAFDDYNSDDNHTSHEEDDRSGGDHDHDEVEGKGSTGRWTREEHLTFVKGLEMYGKQWKKIADMVKTRTVVQIRTVKKKCASFFPSTSSPLLVATFQHAQKFFLKIAKAKQNGDFSAVGEGNVMGGGRRKKRRHLCGVGPVAVAPPLLPFVQHTDDVTDGLFSFLSPPLPPAMAMAADDGGAGGGGPVAAPEAAPGAAVSAGHVPSLSMGLGLGLHGSLSSFGRYASRPSSAAGTMAGPQI